MINILDGFREHLEDLGGGLGLTDPVSGNDRKTQDHQGTDEEIACQKND